jgi:large conductance mechanosensitive channel
MIKGFKEFLLKNQILGLALAVVIGGALGKVVSSAVADILMPLISPILPGGEWRAAKLILNRSVGADGKEVINAISYGNFVGNVIDFIVIAFFVYMVTRAFIKEAPAPPPPPTKQCPRCLETVPEGATRCRFCTSELGKIATV